MTAKDGDQAFRAGTVGVGGERLAYRETGPSGGVPIVALHGMASGAATWDRLAEELAGRGRRVIAVDLPGHGGSARSGRYELNQMRDSVAGFLDQLGAGPVDLVGHSLGGFLATLIAARTPSRVRRLVLEDVPAPPDPSVRPADDQHGGRSLLPGRAMLLVRNLFVLTRARKFDVRMASPVVRQLRTPDPLWWQELARISAATVLIGGGATSHVPDLPMRRMAAVIPGARLVTIAGAGHRVHSRRPEQFSDVVVPFLTGS
jgi:pimeloyl-ACP methyl ester carboxylesterase